jgi:anthranilate synthase component 1
MRSSSRSEGRRAAGRVWPSRSDFLGLARGGFSVPVCREMLADLETPVSAFLKIHRGPWGFLLESVHGGERWGRYSFLGTEPAGVIRITGGTVTVEDPLGHSVAIETDDPLGELRRRVMRATPVTLPGVPRFTAGAVGYLGYDVVRAFERLPATVPKDMNVPDATLLVPRSVLVFDNVAQKITAVTPVVVDDVDDPGVAYEAALAANDALLARLAGAVTLPVPVAGPPGELVSNVSPERYQAAVRRAKEYIRAGDVIQVVLSQRFEQPLRAAPFDVYRCLRTLNPSPYMFYLHLDELQVAGASPEVMARVEDDVMTVRPIAGTRPRGTSEMDDGRLEHELRADPKELAEHVMLLDLGRNDVGRVAEAGSVAVTERFVVERYSHVMHLVSNVEGRLAKGRDCFDAFRAAFPAGTLSGAPKIRAMEIIEELEPVRRGLYGYFDASGAMDTAITIRTVVMQGGRAFVQAGAGIVADSDPEAEHQECVNKARGMLQALRMAEDL